MKITPEDYAALKARVQAFYTKECHDFYEKGGMSETRYLWDATYDPALKTEEGSVTDFICDRLYPS
jgi:hypothetical protein